MAQSHDTVAGSSCMISNKDRNGLKICKTDISIELLTKIFCYFDRRTLLNCQLVCKQWKMVIQNYVWWKKAGLLLNKLFSRREDLAWQVYYLIYKKKPPFERKNLLKNHSGEQRFQYWNFLHYRIRTLPYSCWKIENPPSGVPELPFSEPVFEGNPYCFATFRDFKIHSKLEGRDPITKKTQQIDVISQGFDAYILDVLQPPIMISEWYSCQKNFPAIYECEVELLSYPKTRSLNLNTLDSFQFTDIIEGDRLGKWQNMSHVFTNYGSGLRYIKFMHNGAYHLPIKEPICYGCKMAGACVRIMIPQGIHTDHHQFF
ncbi:F-box only protein 2-like [Cataglyphis hispanica]|uniref:F-box only protein 2-like n=1 Tax=Cataglyphis hispanica TaxID=1086592 RepID=UPI00217F8B1D|nr:F-box only protein 2-like [Cataglyphis hispanica]